MSHLGPDQWVISQFYFRVTVDGNQLSFQEVSGLETTNEVIEYRHGDSEEFITTKRLGMTKTSELTLKKGAFADDDNLMELFNKVYDKEYMSTTDGRMDIMVELLDETGEAMMVWNIHNAIPTKLSLGGLKSDANEAAVEELTFVYEKMVVSL
jgi:phage tail-like protein